MTNILWFHEIGMTDVPQVGGKNASLGEMVSNLSDAGVSVPGGFATTADAYREFLAADGLYERIRSTVEALDVTDVAELARVGANVREWIEEQPLPAAVESDIRRAYASLYNDRAIAYRVHHGFDHHDVALSAGIQRMVRSDVGASGVLFTVDTESGFDRAVFITSSYGLGEAVVQGAVNPDEFYAYKPALREGRPAILKRSVGEKALKMVYADGTHAGASTVFTDVALADRGQFSITDAEVE